MSNRSKGRVGGAAAQAKRAASSGLKVTFDLLATTTNEAAVAELVAALDSPHSHIQEAALRAVLRRRSPTGGREVLRRLHTAGDSWREILCETAGGLSASLRAAVLASDPQLCANGCQAILWIREFDMIPPLVNAAEDPSNPNANRAAVTVLELAGLLYEELALPRDYRNRRDPQLVRQHVVSSLELSVKRYKQHKRLEIIEAFLLLANRDNTTLKKILADPYDGSYLKLVEALTGSPRPGVMRLLLGYLDDSRAPSAAITTLAHRGDLPFLRHLLRKVGYEPSAVAAQNLKRIESFAWLRDNLHVIDELDDECQHAIVQLVLASGMKRLEAFRVIEHLLRKGKVGGRRAAMAAMVDYSGGDANQLTVAALDDPDPKVQAQALTQLRSRGIPGAMSRLLERVESPHEVVREAVRAALSEFSFERFLGAFDMLDEEVRQGTGALVKKIDTNTVPRLAAELAAAARTRRLRAIEMAIAVGAAVDLQEPLLELIGDDDHFIRAAVATSLGQVETPQARAALTDALNDRSVSVQDAARESLARLNQGRTSSTSERNAEHVQ